MIDLPEKGDQDRLPETFQKIVARAIKRSPKNSDRHKTVAHELLQNRESRTLVCELPLWLHRSEFPDLWKMLSVDQDTVTGHVDTIRMDSDGGLQILDLKPAYEKEVEGGISQVLIYSIMFSVRTGVSLSRLSCGVYNDSHSVVLNPVQLLKENYEKILG